VNISSIGNNITSATGEPGGAAPAATAQQRGLIQAVKAVNATELFGQDSELTFVMDQKLQEMIVRVIDRSTGEVKLQIPAEYLLQLAEELKGG
jgi:uncharacterized FlaG/YvyC family protein